MDYRYFWIQEQVKTRTLERHKHAAPTKAFRAIRLRYSAGGPGRPSGKSLRYGPEYRAVDERCFDSFGVCLFEWIHAERD
jgi:hypothetical protein